MRQLLALQFKKQIGTDNAGTYPRGEALLARLGRHGGDSAPSNHFSSSLRLAASAAASGEGAGRRAPCLLSRARRLGALPRRREDPKWWSSATSFDDGGDRSRPLMAGSGVPAGVQAEVVGVRTEEVSGALGGGRRCVGKAVAMVTLGPVMGTTFGALAIRPGCAASAKQGARGLAGLRNATEAATRESARVGGGGWCSTEAARTPAVAGGLVGGDSGTTSATRAW